MQTLPEATAAQTGYRPGEAGYRRLSVALFAAGLATFAMLYSTQPLLPELARVFQVSPSQSAFSVSWPHSAWDWHCSSPALSQRSSAAPS